MKNCELQAASKIRLRITRTQLLSTSYHRMLLWEPLGLHQLRYLKALVRIVPPGVNHRGSRGLDDWANP